MTDLKAELHATLRSSRALLIDRLEGLDEYDRRRPLTSTGTNLLGLVKHLTGVEHVYLGDAFGRPAPDLLPWVEDGSVWQDADMWATAEESSTYLLELYERACAHGDETIDRLDLDAPGSVPHWPAERRATTLGVLLIRMVDETAHHAGHADIVRELIDGRADPDTTGSRTAHEWRQYVGRIQEAADSFALRR